MLTKNKFPKTKNPSNDARVLVVEPQLIYTSGGKKYFI